MKRDLSVSMNPYVSDILSQPAALRSALQYYPADSLELLSGRVQSGAFSRIVLTGMGSSFNAAYPAWLNLLPLTTSAIHVNTAELLHYGQNLMDSQTLLWINSQSGHSVEVVRLLEALEHQRPAFQLSMSNDINSPIALSADLAVAIHAGDEATVSTKTYLNMLAVLLLASKQLVGEKWQSLMESMYNAADIMETFFADWQGRVAELDALLGEVDQLLVLGRGASMGAVWNGSLISKEAAKCAFEGMNAADFRHGPLELASSRLSILLFEGASNTRTMNRDLGLEVVKLGGKVVWMATQRDPDLPTFLLPKVDGSVRPLVEILPLQALTIIMAHRTGLEPGKFRHIGKVTTQE